jgi:octaprenyl-diphosphate synthase
MVNLETIRQPVRNELKQFDVFFNDVLRNDHPLLKYITNFILRRKGKQIRPLFVLLIAKLNGEINEKTYLGASLIELLHSATLIHDDVVDDSDLRRGFFSLKSLWGNKIAVLVGDYLLSKGLLLSINNNITDLLEIVSEAVKEMAEGELLQLKKSRLLDFQEEDYFEIIRKKTAMLIAASGSIGAKSVDADENTIKDMKNFGTYIGMAFQIKDDNLDIQKINTGKSFGNDIRENKITLPLIKAFQNADPKDKRLIIRKISNKKKNNKDIYEIINFITKYKGIEQAELILKQYIQNAYEILDNYKDSEVKKALKDFITYNINRKK